MRVLPSVNVPMADNCSLVVSAIVSVAGTIANDARSAAFTLTGVLPLTEPDAAVIVTLPRLSAVTRPLTVMDATLDFDELHVTVPVMFCVEPSENVPVAVNCCKVPSGRDAFTGVTAMELRVAFVTVKIAPAETLPAVAVIVDVPEARPFASPIAPLTLMLATDGLDEVHWTDDVRFCVLLSVNVPVTPNCVVVPGAMETVRGATASDTSAGAVTVNPVLPLICEDVAVIVAVPCSLLVTMPELDTVAALVLEELQVTELVRFWLLPSVNVPVAVNCTVVPSASDVFAGETASETSAAAVTFNVVLPLIPE